MPRHHFLRYGAAGIAVLGLALFAGWWQVDGPGAPEPAGQRPLDLSAMDFRLTDDAGNAVGPEALIGRPSMVFFGFTYCPDVCPTTLSDISSWLNDLGEDEGQLNVVFITVDPERDTVEALYRYNKDDLREIGMVDRTTPTTGKDLSILDQLIGNLGRFGRSGN